MKVIITFLHYILISNFKKLIMNLRQTVSNQLIKMFQLWIVYFPTLKGCPCGFEGQRENVSFGSFLQHSWRHALSLSLLNHIDSLSKLTQKMLCLNCL